MYCNGSADPDDSRPCNGEAVSLGDLFVREFTVSDLRARDERMITETLLYVSAPHDWFPSPEGIADIITTAEGGRR